ncbi:MAG TPA: 3-deoxy-7-phosphoheptulonate synthase [Pseudonocardiaceae bacterium]|jgi:3-deoxy-7-phosphoheptulonate synthase|nr:3-deoxy-7-phosphoheptulonate synthase [Pseudonocardiaceae bacterium]
MPPRPSQVRDLRIEQVRPLISPALLREELPLTDSAAELVARSRRSVVDVLDGTDDRLLVVVGPCSVHDPAAALDYASRLAAVAEELRDDLLVVMRVYFEKPRTTVGWKGLLNDPNLDGSYNVNAGLRTARRLLGDILGLGLPVGCEFLDPIIPQYTADLVAWGSIGARTAASQVHRQLSSGLSMPIGIKNATDGNVQIAVDAVRAAGSRHVFPGITDDGVAALLNTTGNPDCHVILRGSDSGPNYDSATVASTVERLASAGLSERLLIDASHGNSGKDHHRQPIVVRDVASRVAAGERGIRGLMVESFLAAGRQDLILGRAGELRYGQSITDACLDWAETENLLRELAAASVARRERAVALVGSGSGG